MEQPDFCIDMDEFRELFIDEARRHLQTLNLGALDLEQAPDDATLTEVFRAAHTLKGMAATMGYDGVTKVAHALEDLLDHTRTHGQDLTATGIGLLFEAIDAIETLVDDVVGGGTADQDVSRVLARLRAGSDGTESPTPGPGTYESSETDAPRLGAPEHGMLANDEFEGAPCLTLGPLSMEAVPAPEAPVAPEQARRTEAERFGMSRIVRLDVAHLDRLLDIVTEMVIHRGTLNRLTTLGDLSTLGDALATHSRLVDQLQDAVLATRMVPVSQIFDRFPRMVRDLLQAQGKEARLVVEDAQVELDRTTLAALGDALVHLLRNAVDHGIELPDERLEMGKPRQATLRLAASYERNTVVIEVRDDGRGMDAREIGVAAVERGLVTQSALSDLDESQILALICAPGFTLSSQVTEVSGRGVGMEAVKRQIELMRGSLEIESRLGEGSTFRLHLPSNLALLDALLVVVDDVWYAVPAAHVETIIEVDPRDLVHLGDRTVLSRPDGLLTLRSGCEVLGGRACRPFSRYVLVMQRHGRSLGVGVDSVVGYEQIVAKPLPPVLQAISVLSGMTILDQGRVAFIVDLVAG